MLNPFPVIAEICPTPSASESTLTYSAPPGSVFPSANTSDSPDDSFSAPNEKLSVYPSALAPKSRPATASRCTGDPCSVSSAPAVFQALACELLLMKSPDTINTSPSPPSRYPLGLTVSSANEFVAGSLEYAPLLVKVPA